jgi:CheY-like chemotaxis protein
MGDSTCASSARSRIRVLLIDDDESTLELTALLLERRGFDVLAANDVETAFDLVLADTPDVAVTDLEMPGLDGFDFRHAIELSGAPIPVLAVSGAADHRTLARARIAGFQAVLMKPCPSETLAAALYRSLGVNAPPEARLD